LYNIAKTDGYKFSHFKQYRPGTKFVSSYIEARGCDRNWNEMVVAGGTYLIDRFLNQPLVTPESLERMKERVAKYGTSFNVEGFQYLLDNHKGMCPLRVQMLPEGMVVPLRTPILQVMNTDENCAWVTSYIETHALRSIWYPSTVATVSFHIKRIIKKYMEETAGHINGLDFMLHDFGARGVSSSESAQIGGLAHLYCFKGSDTFEAIELAEEMFGEDMAAFSVDAAEHSTITSFGGPQYELEAFDHMLNELGLENRIFSVVSDSYDIWDAVDNKWGKLLKDKVIALGNKNAKLVVRPDSGDPTVVPVDCIKRLMDRFGFTVNTLGYKVLPKYIGVLQGDGINEDSIRAILENMKRRNISAENIVFGMGGELLQKVNRDTLKFAQKASAAKGTWHNGEWYDVFKDPVGDSGKASKKGRLAVIDGYSGIESYRAEFVQSKNDLLEVRYNSGYELNRPTFQQIRDRINAAL
jgi:nicotinamide phosphoribosyltransferase